MSEVKIMCTYTKLVPVQQLVEHPKNPNKHPEKQIEMLGKIMLAQGFRRPIVVSNRSGFVIVGHGRLAAAKHIGMDAVPVDYQDYENEAAEYADMVADNKIAELSEFDNGIFKDLLNGLDEDFDFDLLGCKETELNSLLAENARDGVHEDNIEIETAYETAKKNQRIKLGQIAVLGNHILMCGNACDSNAVEKLMDGKLAAMVFTDPPYNVSYKGGTKDKMTIQNDNLPADEFYQLLHNSMANMFTAAAPGAAIYVCHADSAGNDFRRAMGATGWSLRQCLIWVKNSFVMGRQDYQWQHEPILYGWKPGAGHKFYGGRKQSSVIENPPIIAEDIDGGYLLHILTAEGEVLVKVPDYELQEASETTIWHCDKPQRNGGHPTMKPISLCARAIINSSKKGDIVLDLFGGSGSTLIAAEQTGRRCRMMELDPIYATVIINRFENETGTKAVITGQEA